MVDWHQLDLPARYHTLTEIGILSLDASIAQSDSFEAIQASVLFPERKQLSCVFFQVFHIGKCSSNSTESPRIAGNCEETTDPTLASSSCYQVLCLLILGQSCS
jgi:hypothetical protein